MSRVHAALLAAGLVLGGCSLLPQPGPLDTSKYDRSCAVDSDCMVVPMEVCTSCGDIGAIARSDKDRYEADREDAAAACPPMAPAACCFDCANAAVCSSGTCAVGSAGPVHTSDAGAGADGGA